LARGEEWLPLDLSDPALKAPVVEKDADAEVIFWDVRLDDHLIDGLAFYNYLRIKVFTERGRALESKVDITFAGNFQIENIAARTIKPDGTIVDLNRDDIFDRTIVKLGGAKVKAKSFAMPGVEVGSIIEYRWHEIRPQRIAYYIRLPFQRDIPVRHVTYHFRPSARVRGAMRLAYFHMPPTDLMKEKNNFYSLTMTSVPAFREEPHMPPEDEVRPWMLVYYVRAGTPINKEKFWQDLGKQAYEIFKPSIKVNDEVRRAAREAVGSATTDEEKLQRLFDYCRRKIKNVNSLSSGMTAEERADRKQNKSPEDTLKSGEGNGFEINALFAALAAGAGCDARIILLSDRSDTFFDPGFPDPYFLSLISIAVKVGDKWRFLDPGSEYVSYGMLRWQEEGEDALVPDPSTPFFLNTPMSPPEESKETRSANLRLTQEGTVEGDVRIEYTGHLAVAMKKTNDDESPIQREQTLRDAVKKQMATAELSDVHIENVTDPVKPFVYVYHVRVPGYAELTGKRIFLQPAFFQHGLGPVFSARDRKNNIYFAYPWSEQDEVTIELPGGYALESLDALDPISTGGISECKSGVYIQKDGREITYRRSFLFGVGGSVFFLVNRYSQLKDYFDLLHHQDNYTIPLKQTATGSPN
jgi:transglutaminase-like putative cysteine protease